MSIPLYYVDGINVLFVTDIGYRLLLVALVRARFPRFCIEIFAVAPIPFVNKGFVKRDRYGAATPTCPLLALSLIAFSATAPVRLFRQSRGFVAATLD